MDTQVVSMSWLLYNAAMDMGVHIYLLEILFLFSSDIYPEVELVGHMIVLFLIFEDAPYCFP